jgi:hypothetical protein
LKLMLTIDDAPAWAEGADPPAGTTPSRLLLVAAVDAERETVGNSDRSPRD